MTDTPSIPSDLNVRQLGIMIKMLHAKDPKTRDTAARALKNTDPEKVAAILNDPTLVPEAISFFARHAGRRTDWIEALLSNPSLSEADRSALKYANDPAARRNREIPADDDRELSLSQRIQRMKVGDKIKLAMKGDKEARTILAKDTNREVFMAVLGNPGMKESEVEMLAKNTGTNTDILRAIGRNREWVANRNIMLSLVLNPKTPVEITVRFLPRLMKRDLEFVAKSRSLPQALRTNATRILQSKAKGR
jgi:hypothetical protein